MTDSPLSRRQFLGATAATAAVVALPAPAEAKPSPFAPEPPPPAGVCQRVGSARFRELTGGYQFSPDSKWLAQFDGRNFVGYEVATGRRAKWTLPHDTLTLDELHWQMTTGGEVLAVQLLGLERPIYHFDLVTGRERKGKVVAFAHGQTFTPDGTGLIQYEDAGKLYRLDVRTGKKVWSRKWKCDASVPIEPVMTPAGWLVGLGMKQLHLFDPLTGKDGPKLEDALPKDSPPDNHFTLVGFSADGKRVCGCHTSEGPAQLAERLVVWDLTTGQVVGRVTPPEVTFDFALTADGLHLLTVDPSGRLVGVSVRTGTVTRKLAATDVGQFLLSPDGKTLVCGRANEFLGAGVGGFIDESGSVIRLVNPATGELLPQSPDPSCTLSAVRFADKHTLVTALASEWNSPPALLWDTRTSRRRVAIGEDHPNFGAGSPPAQPVFGCFGVNFGFAPSPAELSPDGTRWATEFRSRLVVLDAFTGRVLHDLGKPLPNNQGLFWIGRGRVGSLTDAGLVVWNLADHTHRTVPLKFATECIALAVVPTPDGRTVVMLHTDADAGADPAPPTLTWVDIPTGKLTTSRVEHGRLSVSADGQRAAVTAGGGELDAEGCIRVTVIDRGGRSVSFRTDTGFDVIMPRAELSPCGRTAFLSHRKPSEGEDADPIPVVQFWETLSGELRAEFVTPFAADGLGVSPCGRRIATTHRDAPIYLWDVFGETSDPQAKPDATTWAALDGTTDKAFTAIRRLVQHPAAAVDLLRTKLTPAEQPKAEWVKARIDKLGSTDFRTRHTADLELSAVADRIVEPLRKAVAVGADSPEADERLSALLAKSEGMPRSAWQSVRAVEALEYCDVPEAAVLLKKLAGGVDTAVLTKEAKAAVRRRG